MMEIEKELNRHGGFSGSQNSIMKSMDPEALKRNI
jgi:hypothetical protein